MGLRPKPLILYENKKQPGPFTIKVQVRELKTKIRKEGDAMERITIVVKPNSRKMTPEELQGYLKAKAMGSGITKNGKAYRRHDKHRRRLRDSD